MAGGSAEPLPFRQDSCGVPGPGPGAQRRVWLLKRLLKPTAPLAWGGGERDGPSPGSADPHPPTPSLPPRSLLSTAAPLSSRLPRPWVSCAFAHGVPSRRQN